MFLTINNFAHRFSEHQTLTNIAGTGVFQSHQRVIQGTDSTAASLLLWVVGIVYCLCGTHVYIEYGLNVPRYTINGQEQSVPRSGGDLNYLQYVYPWPAYRKNTITLSTCIFGAGFIAFGNMAGNAINFAVRMLRAAGYPDPNEGAVRGIAIAVATLTCFIHAFSRRGGIYLNNIFAIVKLSILLLIVFIAIAVGAGGLPDTPNVISENTNPKKSFHAENTDANGYAHAFLAVIFSFWGFEQPNNIMGEISNPKRKFPISMISGVVLICSVYFSVMISYMVVVPKDEQINYPGGVAQRFFELTLDRVSGTDVGYRVFNAFLAISSIGNMIVMTYTAARVKQEVAKEGVLPYAKFFAQNTDLSLGRLLQWFRRKGWFASLLRQSWLLPENHSEKTPIGAFFLHFFSCLILIFATWGMKADAAYDLLTTLSVYVINCCFGFFVGLGILVLRFKGPPPTAAVDEDTSSPIGKKSWSNMTRGKINPVVSVVTATIFTICNAWPVVTVWVAPTGDMKQGLAWWLIPTIAWAVLAFGVAWYLGFLTVAKKIHRDKKLEFVVEKKPEFEAANPGGGHLDEGLVLVHETTYLSWVGSHDLPAHRQDMSFADGADQHVAGKVNDFSGTDFASHFAQGPPPAHVNGFDGPQNGTIYQQQGSMYAQHGSPYQTQRQQFNQHQYGPGSFSQSPHQHQGSFAQQSHFHSSHQQPPRGYTRNTHEY